jgi:hypothetical protein
MRSIRFKLTYHFSLAALATLQARRIMKKLLLLLLLIIVAYLAWRWWRGHESAITDRGQTLIFNRVWIDHVPKSETESVQSFAVLTREPLGIFDKRSHWKGEYELFRHEPRGDGQLELLYPQSRDKQRVSYRAWQCNTPGFDFCLELSGGKGARKYYSQRGWEVDSLAAAQRLESRLLPAY